MSETQINHLHPVINLAELTLVPSYICKSANCVGCYKKNHAGHSEVRDQLLDFNMLQEFLDQYLSHILVQSFGITGGEFTDYPLCCELVAMLTKRYPGVSIEIVTNGQNHECIAKIIEATGQRKDLLLYISIDGYRDICDHLRGKEGYFSEAILSINELSKRGLASCVRIGTRYYPEHEDSIIELSDYLHARFEIPRTHFSLGTVTYRAMNGADSYEYIQSLWLFARRFWEDIYDINVPNTPAMLIKDHPYILNRKTTICAPAIQPDGYVCSCDTKHGMRAGHISGSDVLKTITKLLSISQHNSQQCDLCHFGHCVAQHYKYFSNNRLGKIP